MVFIIPNRYPVSIKHSFHSSPHPSPWQPLIYLLSLWIYSSGIFIEMESRNTWLLSISTVCSRFIHVVTRVSALLLFMVHNIPLPDGPHFIYPFFRWSTCGLFPLLDCCEMLLWTFMDMFLCGHMFSFSWADARSGIAGLHGDSVSEAVGIYVIYQYA